MENLVKGGHTLRLMDRAEFETTHELFIGDVTEIDDIRNAAEGVDAILITHMAPRQPNAYETPELCFKINVTGTANIFQAAQENGIGNIVVISSTGRPPEDPKTYVESIPIEGQGLYGLTKECQETIAAHYVREHGMNVALLRPGYILNADKMKDKYGRSVGERNVMDVDRRDIGEVARLALEQAHPGLQIFPVMSTPESLVSWNVQHTINTLGWTPRYDFNDLPWDGKE
jgi:nucleoside-diphosphate-sugar epimerase